LNLEDFVTFVTECW